MVLDIKLTAAMQARVTSSHELVMGEPSPLPPAATVHRGIFEPGLDRGDIAVATPEQPVTPSINMYLSPGVEGGM